MVKKIFIVIGIIAGLGAVVWLWMWQGKPKELPPTDETIYRSGQGSNTGQPAADLPFDILIYQHDDPAFRISYPSIYSVIESYLSGGVGTLPAVVAVSSPEEERTGTNLIESSVVVGISNDPGVTSKCAEALEGETKLGSIPISGAPFDIFTSDGAAAGNLYQTIRYRTVKDGRCYEITLLMHSGNIGNYPAGEVREFEKATILERLKTILYSFQF